MRPTGAQWKGEPCCVKTRADSATHYQAHHLGSPLTPMCKNERAAAERRAGEASAPVLHLHVRVQLDRRELVLLEDLVQRGTAPLVSDEDHNLIKLCTTRHKSGSCYDCTESD
jgi:hypothetical protein